MENMDLDKDDTLESLIENFRPRLKQHIVVDQVLDHLHFIGTDQKENIRQKKATEGDSAAADLLISAVIKRPHTDGWFRAFVDALSQAGCEYAADYMQLNLPKPEVEAENDYCILLIQILSPSLLDMTTGVVCEHCFSQRLITKEDNEIVSTHL